MSGTLALAASIASMDRQALSRLVAERRVVSPAAVNEPLGLALELLRTDSILRALHTVHRDRLEALLAVSEGRDADPEILEQLLQIGLLGVDAEHENSSEGGRFVALPEVSEALPSSIRSPGTTPPEVGAKPEELSGWFAAALTSVRRVAKLLHTIAGHPIKLGRKGRPAVVAVRDLADAAHCTPEQTAHLIDVMRAAGLLNAFRDHTGAELLGVSEAATQRWLMQLDYPERWIELARAATSWFDSRLRRGIHETGGNLGAVAERLPHDYPLLPEADFETLHRVIEAAEDLGLTVHGWLAPPAEALLRGDEPAALAIAETDIPAPAAGVYVQPDLSIIVPGPLPPEDEAILNAIAETEQLGPAASMRISPERLSSAALRADSGTASIREALGRLSLTGIPQPLDYLLRDLDRRAAERAAPEAGFGTASAPFDDDRLSAPRSRSDESSSRTTGEDGAGPRSALPDRIAPTHERDDLLQMIDRVLAAALDAGSEGDLTRRLELAIRDRSPVRVTAVAGKDEREFTLLPVSLKGGRLRATDQQAGVERTLPVSAITAVAVA